VKVETFIRKKKPLWDELEQVLRRKTRGRHALKREDLEKLGRDYRAVTSDLAYARARYPEDQVTGYLNQLVARTHAHVYRRKRNDLGRIYRFYLYGFPRLFRATGTYTLVSFLVVALFGYMGYAACSLEPELIRTLLSDGYVDMTERNIMEGTPLAVYGSGPSPILSSFVMSNNILVTFNAFALGILFGAGTLYVLAANGLMLGAFFQLFHLHGMLPRALSTVMIHGTIELTCVIIAGGAGLHFGKALLFPGSYLRREALQLYGARAIKLVLGVVPLLVIAGVLEGFVTPQEPPTAVRLVIIGVSLLLLAVYLGLPRPEPASASREAPEQRGELEPRDFVRGRSRRAVLIPVLLGMLAGSPLLPGGGNALAQNSPPPVAVKVAPVEEREVGREIDLVGRIWALRRSRVASRVAGWVDEVAVEEGDTVKEGQLLARLDDSILKLELASAEAELEKTQTDAKRAERLFEEEVISDNELLSNQTAHQTALARRDLARERLLHTQILAPFAGVVTAKHIERGEWASAGTPVVDILDLSRVRAVGTVTPAEVGDVEPGQPAQVRVDAHPERVYRGAVEQVIPLSEQDTRGFPVRILVENPDRELMAGMLARVHIQAHPPRPMLLVPKDAVVRRGTRDVVYRLNGSAVEELAVSVGFEDGSYISVTGALEPGEKVVVVGNESLMDGASVVLSGS
jgi:RND family efflux transporter MFP subunit